MFVRYSFLYVVINFSVLRESVNDRKSSTAGGNLKWKEALIATIGLFLPNLLFMCLSAF